MTPRVPYLAALARKGAMPATLRPPRPPFVGDTSQTLAPSPTEALTGPQDRGLPRQLERDPPAPAPSAPVTAAGGGATTVPTPGAENPAAVTPPSPMTGSPGPEVAAARVPASWTDLLWGAPIALPPADVRPPAAALPATQRPQRPLFVSDTSQTLAPSHTEALAGPQDRGLPRQLERETPAPAPSAPVSAAAAGATTVATPGAENPSAVTPPSPAVRSRDADSISQAPPPPPALPVAVQTGRPAQQARLAGGSELAGEAADVRPAAAGRSQAPPAPTLGQAPPDAWQSQPSPTPQPPPTLQPPPTPQPPPAPVGDLLPPPAAARRSAGPRDRDSGGPPLQPLPRRPTRVSIGTIEVTVTPPQPAFPTHPTAAEVPRRARPPSRLGAGTAGERLRDGRRRWYGTAQA